MNETFVNKVAESGIVTLNLEEFYPKEPIMVFDMKDYLFMGLILKEKDFRAALSAHDWNSYDNKNVGVFCSADAIIPNWAFMLVVTYLDGHAKFVYPGSFDETVKAIVLTNIQSIETGPFNDQRVVVKGCGDKHISAYAYLQVTIKLKPVVKSLMYGEPCSTVPVYKRK